MPNLFLLIVIIILNYPSHGQNGRVKIDNQLDDVFFHSKQFGVSGDYGKTIYDSLPSKFDTLSKNESILNKQREIVVNSFIKDKNHHHYSLTFCRCTLVSDSLLIEFGNESDRLTNRIYVIIENDMVNGRFLYYKDDTPAYLSQKNIEVILKEPVSGKGQFLLGVLKAEFKLPRSKKTYMFEGPFKCIIE